MNTPSLVFGKDVFSLPPPMVQEMVSLVVRREFPIHRVPMPQESLWTECQTTKSTAAVGTRFLVQRLFVACGTEAKPRWIVHDYILTRTTPNAFGGWSRQLVAYFMSESTPYYAFNLCLASTPSAPSSPSQTPCSVLSLLQTPRES